MAKFNYARAKLTADRLIDKFGQTAILRGYTLGGGGDPWNPTGSSSTDYSCTVALVDYSSREKEGTLIQARDRRALIAVGSLSVIPDASFVLVIGSEVYAIANITQLNPGGTVVMYDAQVRL